MIYLLFPMGNYTYEHLLLTDFLFKRMDIKHQETPPQLTLLIQSRDINDQLFFFKDVAFRDEHFTTDRLLQITKNPNLIEESGISEINALSADMYKPPSTDGLAYKLKYNLLFENGNTYRVNALVHNVDTLAFFERSMHYTSAHKTKPILFHNLYSIKRHYEFDTIVKSVYRNEITSFLTRTRFRQKLTNSLGLQEPEKISPLANYEFYHLNEYSQIKELSKTPKNNEPPREPRTFFDINE